MENPDRRSSYWPLKELKAACSQKGISCGETNVFSVLNGAIVSCGQTVIINIASSLADGEKRWTLGHELAHLVLGHLNDGSSSVQCGEPSATMPWPRDEQKEREADTWAVHLLVNPEVYDRHFSAIQNGETSQKTAEAKAVKETAAELDLPEAAVKLWLETRNHQFQTPPSDWLGTERLALASR